MVPHVPLQLSYVMPRTSVAGVRDARLHDARHTAATVLLVLGVPERSVMQTMGWSTTAMAARYQHVTDPIRREVAAHVDGLLWASEQVK
jgi:integrase